MSVTELPAAILAESNLIGYWPMDDANPATARDRGPSNRAGSYDPDCLLGILGIDGQPGGAVKFGEPKNLGQKMTIPYNVAFVVPNAGSVEFCIRTNRWDFFTDTQYVFTAHSTGPQCAITLVGGKPAFTLKKQGTALFNKSISTPIDDTYLWHHVIITWTTANCHIWIDGQDTAGVDSPQTMVANNAMPMTWGDSYQMAAMCHGAYYGKVLDATAVAAHYAAFQLDNAKWPKRSSIKYGLNLNLPSAIDSDQRAAGVENARQSHATVVRSDMSWVQVQSSNGGAYDWTLLDEIVRRVAEGGFEALLGTITYSPTWANGGANAQWVPGASAADQTFLNWVTAYATFVTDMITRYQPGGAGNPHGVDIYWLVWNEPSASLWWKSSLNPQTNGTMYATFYKAIRSAILAVDADAKVVFTGGDTMWYNTPASSTIGLQHLKDALLVSGVVIDYADYHAYTTNNNSPDIKANSSNLLSDILTFYDTLCAYGHSSAKVLITELGWNTQVVSAANQAAYLDIALARIRDHWSSFVDMVLVYRDWDGVSGTEAFGLFSTMPDLPALPTPKAAAQNFYKIAAPFELEESVGQILI